MRVGQLPLFPYFRPGDKALAIEIAKHADKHAAVLLANHGPVVSGNDLDSAMYAIEELEETSKLMLLLQGQKIRHWISHKYRSYAKNLEQRGNRGTRSAGSSDPTRNESSCLDSMPISRGSSRKSHSQIVSQQRRSAGFTGIEILFPYDQPASEIRTALQSNGQELVLINAPPGNFAAGERGLAALPGREKEFREKFGEALDYAEALDCKRIHIMSGITGELDQTVAHHTFLTNLEYALHKVEKIRSLHPDRTDQYRDFPGILSDHR